MNKTWSETGASVSEAPVSNSYNIVNRFVTINALLLNENSV